MVIVVCGDSFCAAEKEGPRDHFSQQLEDSYGHQIINLARGGMSNIGICFQLKQALTMQPDVIVFNRTWSDRVELVMPGCRYIPEHGLRNFIYAYPTESTFGQPWVGGADAAVFSTVWQGLDEQSHVKIIPEQVKAVELYLKYLFDDEMKTETDSWAFGYWIDRIKAAGIACIEIQKQGFGRMIYDFAAANMRWPTLFHTDKATQTLLTNAIQQRILGE